MVEHHDDSHRRFKVFTLAERQLLAFLNQASIPPGDRMFLVPRADLPAGYRVRSIHYDPYRQSFLLVICHPSWPAVDEQVISTPEAQEIAWRRLAVTAIEC